MCMKKDDDSIMIINIFQKEIAWKHKFFPFECNNYPAITIYQNNHLINLNFKKDKKMIHSKFQMIVLQKKNNCFFNIYVACIEWKIVRLLWIAFLKNSKNNASLIAKLPKDVFNYIIQFLANIFIHSNDNNINLDKKKMCLNL